MKYQVTISGLHSKDLGEDFISELKGIFDDGHPSHYFSMGKVDENDERIPAVLSKLADAGLEPWEEESRFISGQEFAYIRFRIYEEEDFENCDYFMLNPSASTPSGYRVDGLIELKLRGEDRMYSSSGLNQIADLMCINAGWYIVPERTKARLEASDLAGPSFRPTKLITGYHTNKEYFDWQQELGSEWWELISDVIMPPLSETTELRDRKSQPLTDRHDFSGGVYPREGFFDTAEFHYRRSDLEAMPLFDLARTYEPMGVKAEYDQRPLIASRRFFDFCCEHDIETNWVPVRIDD
ncbi:MAG: hypothetical protein AAGE65_01660 [Planctomycetota bacterium]